MFQHIRNWLFPFKRVVRCAVNSVRGRMHDVDNIPNQDKTCIMHCPDEKVEHLRGPKTRAETRGVNGLFGIGVFDGHGPRGHEASALAAERMKFAINRIWTDRRNLSLEDVVKIAFTEVAAALTSAQFCSNSGTTASVAVVHGEDVVVGNVGDSTIMFVSSASHRHLRLRYQSRLHRPSDPEEAARIVSLGGRIQQGYVIDAGAKQGIAVSRTLGDRDMQKYGCISEPDVFHFKLERRDVAVVIGSDGLWDEPKLDGKRDVFKAVAGIRARAERACTILQKKAWSKRGPSDDCTVACMMFH